MEYQNSNKTFFKYGDQCFKTCYIESSLRDREEQRSQKCLSLLLVNNRQYLYDLNRWPGEG